MFKKLLCSAIVVIILLILPFGYILGETPSQDDAIHIDINPLDILKIQSQGEGVVNLQMRLRDLGYFNYKVTGYYAEATRGAVALFQEENGLVVDGTVGPDTKDILYSSKARRHTAMPNEVNEFLPASRGGVSTFGAMVDWFSQGQYLFPRGEDAKVTDLNTGRSFSMRRTGGTYHADSEPVTEADSETIKSIWGGWSWDRRAVIVEVGGARIAASMHGMPHAFDRLPNNGMSGHVCIHFYKSRTHVRNKEDADHQAMVRRAAGK
ncbi:MAG TPA: peptidoglycan-binding domain-containing protein [Clostridia bacterium]|nr:peptidoglycan-binding domain-containing protein [Clostridia bacterium]